MKKKADWCEYHQAVDYMHWRKMMLMLTDQVCVCVCLRERERERQESSSHETTASLIRTHTHTLITHFLFPQVHQSKDVRL